MIRDIKDSDNPVVKTEAKSIDKVDENIKKLVLDMAETVGYHRALGLAAPQIGESLKLAIVNTMDYYGGDYLVLLNPEIIAQEEPLESEEGCLSCSGNTVVERYNKITIKYMDLEGNTRTKDLRGLNAVATQHEIDHLNGILIIDKKLKK